MAIPLKDDKCMPAFYPSLTALAVSAIYMFWRSYARTRVLRERTLYERVTFMLWMAARQGC